MAVLVVVVAGLSAGLAVGLSGGGSDPSVTGTQSSDQSGVAFAACMRANGVPNFPDTAVSDTNGRVEFRAPAGIDTSSSQFESVMQTCKKDLPNGGSSANGSSSGSSTQQVIKYAACMRANGVPNFPEPNATGEEMITTSSGITPNSPQFKSASATCQHLLPAGSSLGGGL